jgi:hypothetical protein
MIWTFTYAIFFLAVPHKGSDLALWGQILTKLLLLPENSYLQSVTPGSEYNETLNACFAPLLTAYQFYSWIETLPEGNLGIVRSRDVVAPSERCR